MYHKKPASKTLGYRNQRKPKTHLIHDFESNSVYVIQGIPYYRHKRLKTNAIILKQKQIIYFQSKLFEKFPVIAEKVHWFMRKTIITCGYL